MACRGSLAPLGGVEAPCNKGFIFRKSYRPERVNACMSPYTTMAHYDQLAAATRTPCLPVKLPAPMPVSLPVPSQSRCQPRCQGRCQCGCQSVPVSPCQFVASPVASIVASPVASPIGVASAQSRCKSQCQPRCQCQCASAVASTCLPVLVVSVPCVLCPDIVIDGSIVASPVAQSRCSVPRCQSEARRQSCISLS